MVGFVKGVFGGDSLDLSAVTLTPDKALAGTKFYDADGILRTGTIPSKAASTITLAGAATSIPAGQYLAGAQTIAWDSDIAAGNIKSGVNVFGVAGQFIGNYKTDAKTIPLSATSFTISGLGFTPKRIIGVLTNFNISTANYPAIISIYCVNGGEESSMRVSNNTDWEWRKTSDNITPTFSSDSVTITSDSGYYLAAGVWQFIVLGT